MIVSTGTRRPSATTSNTSQAHARRTVLPARLFASSASVQHEPRWEDLELRIVPCREEVGMTLLRDGVAVSTLRARRSPGTEGFDLLEAPSGPAWCTALLGEAVAEWARDQTP